MERRLTFDDLLLIVTCVVWGANFVVIKATLDELPPLAFNALRFPIAAAVLLALQWHREGFAPLRPHLGRIIVLGLVGNFAYQLFFIFGLDNTRAGQASLLSSTTPVFTFLLAWTSGHDRVDRRVGAGVVLASAGLGLLLRESLFGALAGRGFWVGDLLLLGSTTSWAVYTVWSQPLLGRVRPLALTSVSMAAGSVPLLIVGLPDLWTLRVEQVSATAWSGLTYATFMALVFSYLAWSRGVRALGSTRTAIYLNLVPVVAVVVAWWWLDEVLTAQQLVGAAAIVSGIWLSRSRPRAPGPRAALPGRVQVVNVQSDHADGTESRSR